MVSARKHRELEYWRTYKPTSFDYWLKDFFNSWDYYFVYASGIYGSVGQKTHIWDPNKEVLWETVSDRKPSAKFVYTQHGVMTDERFLGISIPDESLRNQLWEKTQEYLEASCLAYAMIDLEDYFRDIYSLFKLIEESDKYDILFINNMHPNFDSFLIEYGIKDRIKYIYSFHSNIGCCASQKIFHSMGISKKSINIYEIHEGENLHRGGKSGLELLDNYLEWRKLDSAPTRESSEYRKMKKRVRKRDNNTCQCCGYYSNKKTNHNLEVHHIYGYKDHLDYRTEEDNCITLCNDCHKRYHSLYGKKDVNPQTFSKYIRDYNQYYRDKQTTFDKYMEG